MRELSAGAVALLAMATTESPAPEIRETTTYYDVTGQMSSTGTFERTRSTTRP